MAEVKGLKVQVEIKDLDLFKDVLAAMKLMFERADSDTKTEVLNILKDHGDVILVTRE